MPIEDIKCIKKQSSDPKVVEETKKQQRKQVENKQHCKQSKHVNSYIKCK